MKITKTHIEHDDERVPIDNILPLLQEAINYDSRKDIFFTVQPSLKHDGDEFAIVFTKGGVQVGCLWVTWSRVRAMAESLGVVSSW